ncbi:MAG: nitrous oxide reductase family maturation protein NosD [Candidatus Heimdallarchaeota archaeon]
MTPTPLGGVGDYPPPSSGDWIINNPTNIWNETITVNGSILVQSGGNLTLQNVTLRMNSTSDGECNITVYNGGFLNIIENSSVTAVNVSNAWYLNASAGSTLRLVNSTFSYAGWDWGSAGSFSGLWINTPNTEVFNCSISNNYIGLYFFEADDGLIANNTIVNSVTNGISLNASAGTRVSDNKVTESGFYGIGLILSNDSIINNNTLVKSGNLGISLENSTNCRITDNTLLNSSGNGAIQLNNSASNFIINNVITYCAEQGISLRFSSSNCIVRGNVIMYGLVGISITYSSVNSTVANNTIDTFTAGIVLGYFANRTLVSSNIIRTSLYYGIFLNARLAIQNVGSHPLSRPTILHPNGGEDLQGIVTVSLMQDLLFKMWDHIRSHAPRFCTPMAERISKV